MKKLDNSKPLMFLTILFSIILFSSCEIQPKKNDAPSSNSSEEKTGKVEVEAPVDYKSSQPLTNLKTKDLIFSWVDKLNVRDNASLNGKAIASVDSDAALEFTGVKSGDIETIVLRGVAYEDLWYKIVTADGKEGWVFGGAVKRQDESKGNVSITDTKFAFPYFGDFDLSTWKNLGTKTEGEEVDYKITSYQKGNRILERTSADMGEMYYGYDYKLKDTDGKIIKERNFNFNGDGRMLEEKVKDYSTNSEYTRKQTLKKHWYQLNAKPLMVNGNWTKSTLK